VSPEGDAQLEGRIGRRGRAEEAGGAGNKARKNEGGGVEIGRETVLKKRNAASKGVIEEKGTGGEAGKRRRGEMERPRSNEEKRGDNKECIVRKQQDGRARSLKTIRQPRRKTESGWHHTPKGAETWWGGCS